MPSAHRRVQVTVDPELAAALDELEPRLRARSRLIRDLALRGARAERADRRRRGEARDFLLSVVRGETDYDPASALAAHAEREADLP